MTFVSIKWYEGTLVHSRHVSVSHCRKYVTAWHLERKFMLVSVASWVPQETDCDLCMQEIFYCSWHLVLGTTLKRTRGVGDLGLARWSWRVLWLHQSLSQACNDSSEFLLGIRHFKRSFVAFYVHPHSLDFKLFLWKTLDCGQEGTVYLMAASGKGVSWPQSMCLASGLSAEEVIWLAHQSMNIYYT